MADVCNLDAERVRREIATMKPREPRGVAVGTCSTCGGVCYRTSQLGVPTCACCGAVARSILPVIETALVAP